MPLPEDWRQFIESLNSHGVEYVVVGAVALAHHGFPRYTGGLEVLVHNSTGNSMRLERSSAATFQMLRNLPQQAVTDWK